MNTTDIFKKPSLVKLYIFKFSEKNDVFLGDKFMRENAMTINFKDGNLETENLKIPIKSNIKIELKKGLNATLEN